MIWGGGSNAPPPSLPLRHLQNLRQTSGYASQARRFERNYMGSEARSRARPRAAYAHAGGCVRDEGECVVNTEDALIITDVERIILSVRQWSLDFDSIEDCTIRELQFKFEMRDFVRTERELQELKRRLTERFA